MLASLRKAWLRVSESVCVRRVNMVITATDGVNNGTLTWTSGIWMMLQLIPRGRNLSASRRKSYFSRGKDFGSGRSFRRRFISIFHRSFIGMQLNAFSTTSAKTLTRCSEPASKRLRLTVFPADRFEIDCKITRCRPKNAYFNGIIIRRKHLGALL